MGKRAKGRTLAEFSPLSAAEEEILAAAALGGMAVISETRPEAENAECAVRAEFLRFLALGGDDETPVHEKGLYVQGAWITGTLDLSDAEIAGALLLEQCRFVDMPELFDTHIRGLFSLAGSHVPGLNAGGLTCNSGVLLGRKFISGGEVRLPGATIGNYFDCRGGRFENPNSYAIYAARMKVGGDVFMGKDVSMDTDFEAQGKISLRGAAVSGSLDCSGGRFKNEGGMAIDAVRMKVGDNVFMRESFTALGEVRLSGATIGGDLDFYKGTFKRPKGDAIVCKGMVVSGAIYFHDVLLLCGSVELPQSLRGARVVDLRGARVARLVDDLQSWPENSVLDGFVYNSFAGDAPTAAKDRLAWLDKQPPDHRGVAKNPRAFRPQPWLQLRKVLRERGHLEDSRQVAIAFEDRKRACGVIGEISAPAAPGDIVACFRQWLRSRTARGFHWLYGCLIGYGYRPARLFWSLVAVWLAGTVLFDIGGHSRIFGPTDPQIFTNAAYDSCNPEKNPRANWTRCALMPRAYPAFYPPLYALDVLLPIAKLGQQDHWAPLVPARAPSLTAWVLAWATQIAVWGETLFGWIAGLLLVATVTGLAKRHDE